MTNTKTPAGQCTPAGNCTTQATGFMPVGYIDLGHSYYPVGGLRYNSTRGLGFQHICLSKDSEFALLLQPWIYEHFAGISEEDFKRGVSHYKALNPMWTVEDIEWFYATRLYAARTAVNDYWHAYVGHGDQYFTETAPIDIPVRPTQKKIVIEQPQLKWECKSLTRWGWLKPKHDVEDTCEYRNQQARQKRQRQRDNRDATRSLKRLVRSLEHNGVMESQEPIDGSYEVGEGGFRPKTQSGDTVPTPRMVREAIQRIAAKQAKEAKRKSLPKEARKRSVQIAMLDKQKDKMLKPEYQSGDLLKAAAFAAGAFGVHKLGKTMKRFVDKITSILDDAKNASETVKEGIKALELGAASEKLTAVLDKTDNLVDSLQVKSNVAFHGANVLMAEAADTAIHTRVAVNTMVDQASSMFQPVRAILDELKITLSKILGSAMWYIPVLMALVFAVRSMQSRSKTMEPFLSLLVSCVAGAAAWKVFGPLFMQDRPQTQSGIDWMPKTFATMMVFSVFGMKSRDKVGDLMRRVSMVERCGTGLEALLDWVLLAIQTGLNFLHKKFGLKQFTIRQQKNSEVLDWVKRAEMAVLGHNTADVPPSPEIANAYIKLLKEGRNYAEIFRSDRNVGPMIATHCSQLVGIIKPMLGGINSRQNFRQEPVFILLVGGAGIGKTRLTQYMVSCIMSLSGILGSAPTPEDIKNNMWQKGSSEFYNGYVGQKCYIMDDAFQKRVSTSDTQNEYLDIIHECGSWSCPLNMADVDSKGANYFVSDIVFGTTNVNCVMSEAEKVIACPEAFIRRITYGYCLKLKPQYADNSGRLDMTKYATEVAACVDKEHLEGYPFYMWTVQKHHYGSGNTFGDARELVDLIKEIIADVRNRSVTHKHFENDFDSFLSRLKPVTQAGETLSDDDDDSDSDDDDSVDAPKGSLSWHILKEQAKHARNASAMAKVVGVAAMIAAGYAAYKLVKIALGGFFALIKGMFNKVTGRKKKVNQSNRPFSHPMKMSVRKPAMQSGNEIANLAYCNTFKLLLKGVTHTKELGQLMMLNDKLAVCPYHFILEIQKEMAVGKWVPQDRLEFTNAGNREFTFSVSIEKMLKFKRKDYPSLDLTFWRMQIGRAAKNITKLFIRDSDLRHLGGNSGRVDVCELVNNKLPDVDRRLAHGFESMKVGGYLNTDIPMERHISYRAKTQPGDCGAPVSLVGNNSYQNRNIVGIHVAATVSITEGYAAIITQELIETARLELDILDDCFEEDMKKTQQSGVTFTSCDEYVWQSPGSFLPLGVVDKPITNCPYTAYFKTDMYGVFGEYNYYPAPLSARFVDDKMVYPLEVALKPYSSELKLYEQPWLEQVMHVAMRKTTAMTKDCPRLIYSFEEAVKGIPEAKFRSIPRGTSPGFPYVYSCHNGKTDFFGWDQDYNLSSPACQELERRVEHILQAARENVRLAHIFVDFPKDELRPEHKVKACMTRMVSASPLDYTVAWRMMFGAFGSAVMSRHTKSGMAPGICTYAEWDGVATMITRYGTKVFAGDFKSFDASEQPCILELFLNYINDWYNDGDENRRIRTVLWSELVHSRHIGGIGKEQRYVYQWAKSLPSGHPFTTIVNSMYSLFCMVASYSVNTGDFHNFWDHCASVVFGDDNVSGMDDSVADKFNQVTTADALKNEFGMVYTSDVKDGKLVPYTHIEDITFLKRRFLREEGTYLCPLQLDSFLYTIYWCKNKKIQKKIANDVLETALEELSLHEKTTWDEYAPRLLEVMSKYDFVPRTYPTRDAYQTVVRGRKDSWF